MPKNKREKGITLVALIITVIILLILAMVSISLVINSGIIDKAKYGVDKYSEEEELEQIKLAVASARLKGEGFLTIENLNSELQDKFGEEVIQCSKGWRYKNYNIKENGEVIKGILPAEYQQVEYLESTGTQYIDTNLYPNNTMVVEVDTISKSEWSIFGGNGAGNSMFNLTGNKSRSFRYGSTKWNNSGFSYTERAKIIFGREVYLNGKLVYTFPESTFTGNYKLILFGRFNNSNSLNDAGDTTIYYLKIWDNNILVRDYIPCYSTTSVIDVDEIERPKDTIGMYDTVEGKFYVNKGKGTFLKGSDV